jgi:hypothetical protein
VAELADAPALGAGDRKVLGVQIPPPAPCLIFQALPQTLPAWSFLAISSEPSVGAGLAPPGFSASQDVSVLHVFYRMQEIDTSRKSAL